MSESDRKAIQSAEMNVSKNIDSKKIEHRGWDRDDYNLDEIGGFEPVEPGEKVDWEAELDRVRDRLLELHQKRNLDVRETEEQDRLKVRERKIEAYLDESG